MSRTVYIMEHPSALLPMRSPQLRDVMDLDFRRLNKLLTGWRPRYKDDFEIFQSVMDVTAWLKKHRKVENIALDLELDQYGKVDMVGLAASATEARLLILPDPEGLTALFDALRANKQGVIVHYGEGLEIRWLRAQFGRKLPITVHDTHKLFHAYDTEYASAGRDDDDKKGGQRGGSGALAFMQSLFTWRPYHKHLLHESQNVQEKAHYCMLDCVVTWEGFTNMARVCQQEQPQSWKAYLRDAVPLLPIMVDATEVGVDVDAKRFTSKRDELKQRVNDQADALIAVYGEGIKPKAKKAKTKVSVAGLKKVLTAQGIKLPTTRKDGKAVVTLDREARQKLIVKHPELADLDAYWESQDMLSDCYKPIMGKDGKCHPDWTGYLTSWRWRCTHPNIAQWPESEREVFCAGPGRVLVQFDTSAGEYRWFAGESGDPGLLARFVAYDASHDPQQHPHVANTAVLFGVGTERAAMFKSSADPKEKAKYTFSKNYIYRLMYSYKGGIDELRATAAKAGLKFSRKDIEAFDKTWFKTYPVAAEWRERQVRQVLRSRVVVNREWGYTRRLHGQDEDKLANIALNFVMQSGIAGIINKTVLDVWRRWELSPVANMHDGLIYEVPRLKLDTFVKLTQACMEAPLQTLKGIVIPVDIKVGEHWGSGMREWKA